MIKYILKQFKNPGSKVNNHWFAYPVKDGTVGIDDLARHMANHNTPYSAGAIKGIITDMVSCIKELLLEGKCVKLPDLAIFYIGLKNDNGGALTEEDFTPSEHIKSVRMLARATGSLATRKLDLDASLKKATVVVGKKKNEE